MEIIDLININLVKLEARILNDLKNNPKCDIHTKTADELGITRIDAKKLNLRAMYSRINHDL